MEIYSEGIERTINEADFPKWQVRGWRAVTTNSGEQQKPFDKMNKAELEAVAVDLGIAFPDDVKSNQRRIEYLADYASKQE